LALSITMQPNLKEFWSRLQDSVDVLVASRDSEHLLGVRDGFRRFFWHGLGRDVSVVVKPGPAGLQRSSLWSTAEQTVAAAQRNADSLRQEEFAAPFCVGAEEGFVGFPVGGDVREFVHCWTVVVCDLGSACGSSGAIEIPARFTHPGGEVARRPHVPGTRRRGGMIGSLTGGLETRRVAVSHAVVHALSTVFYGYIEIRPAAARWGV
jgi:non-canonical (house-cleaning) NTP pyrophosphatase